MKRNIVAFILCFCLVFGCMTPAFAAESVRVRVEGSEETLYDQVYDLGDEETAYDILMNTLGDASEGGDIVFQDSGYGKFITQVFDEKQAGDYSTWWGVYVLLGDLTELSPKGVSTLTVEEIGDELLLHIQASDTYIPTLEYTEEDGDVEVTVYKQVPIYEGWDVVGYNTEITTGAAITIDGVSKTSNDEGKASFQLAPGKYDAVVSKYGDDNPLLVKSDFEIVVPGSSVEEIINDLAVDYGKNDSSYSVYAGLNKVNKLEVTESERLALANEYKSFKPENNYGTEYFKAFARLTSAGIDPSDVLGKDLVAQFSALSLSDIMSQGTNGAIYGLLALDTHNLQLAETATFTRDDLIDAILEDQGELGGWKWGGGDGIDMGGTALVALAPYYDSHVEVKTAVDKFVNWTSDIQEEDGTIADNGFTGPDKNAAATAQLIMGLVANGVDPEGALFTKTEGDLISYLLTFYDEEEKGFKNWTNYDVDRGFATPQAFSALCAYEAFKESGEGERIYDFSNIDYTSLTPEQKPYDVSVSYTVGKTDNATALVASKDVVAHVTVESHDDSDENILMIVALYDGNGTMQNVTYMAQTLAAGNKATFHGGFRLPASVDGCSVKTFVWDGTNLNDTTGKTLSDVYTLE